MQKSFRDRLLKLETLERAQSATCRGWIVMDPDDNIIDPCPCGRVDEFHKTYVSISPNVWDRDQP